MIDVRNLEKHFGSVRAVDGVTFSVDEGAIFGLLGPNGAGKTTTLRVLATLVDATGGDATIAGFDVRSEAEEVRRRIGVVNGGMGLYDRLSGRETLHWFGRLYGMTRERTEARIAQLDALLDLTGTLDRPCGEFSTGMRQKIVIARAVLHEPEVLFFDEASSGLDVLARRAVLDFARAYPAEGRAVVWSTHVMSEAEELCDRVSILHRGRVLDEGTVAELRARADDAPDLEQAFFRLVRRSGAEPEAVA